ncbi:MAG TPA: hypothetical protein VEI97_16105, partial [bacterium]|nr:hypothetical protein [bacterium]
MIRTAFPLLALLLTLALPAAAQAAEHSPLGAGILSIFVAPHALAGIPDGSATARSEARAEVQALLESDPLQELQAQVGDFREAARRAGTYVEEVSIIARVAQVKWELNELDAFTGPAELLEWREAWLRLNAVAQADPAIGADLKKQF